MSNAPPTLRTDVAELPTDGSTETPTHLTRLAETATRSLTASVRGLGFWAAVSLPAVYLPLLFAGLPGVEWSAFSALLVAHAVALVVGNDYGDA
ncbi:hypothetical protein NGM10_12115 [Halorussus salilacus]|uniref:hypothetical protein n=1 Tax=Halorussus salilacus TaxID=2953750 RepID=UPI00209CAA2C|nr:hypothetical protein [Halorussus salilacus]USZ67469.1 hypothetical protein NGM10_12115 [Halorussus salilacus]